MSAIRGVAPAERVELGARALHAKASAELRLQGRHHWTECPVERCDRCHMVLVPWEFLPDRECELFRDTVRAVAGVYEAAVRDAHADAVRLMRTHDNWCYGTGEDVPPHDAVACVEAALVGMRGETP